MPEPRRLVAGDIHGAHAALLQVFERAGFDPDRDELVVLGDVADGWPEVPECIDTLLKVKHLVAILGNHDEWLLEWATEGTVDTAWLEQGGLATIEAYELNSNNVPASHVEYLKNARDYYIDDANRCFVHAGLVPKGEVHPRDTDTETLRWSRSFWRHAVIRAARSPEATISEFTEIFLGHTPTHRNWSDCKPVKACNVWNLDQGAGWDGRLTLMDVETKEYWQSDFVPALYSGIRGR